MERAGFFLALSTNHNIRPERQEEYRRQALLLIQQTLYSQGVLN
jgi:hypothetical protein